MYFILCILFFDAFWVNSSHAKPVWSFVYVFIYGAGAGKTTSKFVSDELDPYVFRRKMEKTRSMKEEMDGEVFIRHQSWHFSLYIIWLKYFTPFCTLNWRVNNFVSRQGGGIARRNESIINKKQSCSLWYYTHFWSHKLFAFVETLPSY